jgi:Fic family protein
MTVADRLEQVTDVFYFRVVLVLDGRQSFESRHSYDSQTVRPGYSSLTGNGMIPGQQEMLDRIQTMTQVLKQNQQTMDALQKILESHHLVPKKSPFEDSTVL